MLVAKKNPDIVLRLPDEKKILKKEIVRIAKKNRLTLTAMLIYIMEWFLEEIKAGKEFSIKIKR